MTKDFIFCRIGDHYLPQPGDAWSSNSRLYRLMYQELLDLPIVDVNDEIQLDTEEDQP